MFNDSSVFLVLVSKSTCSHGTIDLSKAISLRENVRNNIEREQIILLPQDTEIMSYDRKLYIKFNPDQLYFYSSLFDYLIIFQDLQPNGSSQKKKTRFHVYILKCNKGGKELYAKVKNLSFSLDFTTIYFWYLGKSFNFSETLFFICKMTVIIRALSFCENQTR